MQLTQVFVSSVTLVFFVVAPGEAARFRAADSGISVKYQTAWLLSANATFHAFRVAWVPEA